MSQHQRFVRRHLTELEFFLCHRCFWRWQWQWADRLASCNHE